MRGTFLLARAVRTPSFHSPWKLHHSIGTMKWDIMPLGVRFNRPTCPGKSWWTKLPLQQSSCSLCVLRSFLSNHKSEHGCSGFLLQMLHHSSDFSRGFRRFSFTLLRGNNCEARKAKQKHSTVSKMIIGILAIWKELAY